MAALVVGVIGVGRIGKMHVDNIATRIPTLRIKWVCDLLIDTDPAMGELVAKHGIGKTTKDYHDVLADAEVEAVVITCSTGSHVRISLDALRAGKHVFCEKPVSESPAEIREVMAEVAKSGGALKYQVGFNRRFDRNFSRVREAVRAGEVGTPQILRVTSRDPTYVRSYLLRSCGEGGMMADMTIHDFDMLHYVIGAERADVTEVFAMGAALIVPEVRELGDVDTAVVSLRFAGGALATVDNSREAVYGYDQRVEVFGTAGCVVAENEAATTCRLMGANAGTRREQRDAIPWWFTERYRDAFVTELASFAMCCRAGPEEQPLVTCVDQLRATLVAIAARESLKTGKPVVPEKL